MNKKSLTLLISFLCLTSCGHENLVFSPYLFSDEFTNPKENINNDFYHQNDSYGTLDYIDNDGSTKTINEFKDLYSSSNISQTFRNAPSLGEVNALIIPVNFLDSDTSKNSEQLEIIKSGFFGDESCNEFESLSSYYYKSSYGQLKIKGHISDFYNFEMNTNELVDKHSTSVGISRRVAINALKWFYENNKDFDFSKYDLDSDGYLDALYILYNFPYNDDLSKDYGTFWAYVDHSYRGERVDETISNDQEYAISSYAWLSIDFFGENVKPESRTAIHESGHIFGLSDYYNTSSSGIYQPTGFADMMDANIGDHSAYSKMLLNWTTPIVIDNECEITIEPFNSSGDIILIPSKKGWNNTPYDEYLLLEFYTPSGLNEHDAGAKYIYYLNGNKEKFVYFSVPGLKVYHVDSRLGYFSFKNTNSLICTFDDPNCIAKINEFKTNNTRPYCIDFAFNNDIFRNKEDQTPALLKLLESSGENSFKYGKASSNDTLFKKGDSFGLDTFTTFSFDNGSTPMFDFEIIELNNDLIKIKFLKN